MLGSLTYYRRLLQQNVFTPERLLNSLSSAPNPAGTTPHKLPTLGHAIAGVMAGFTVSFIAAPVEHVKARLQIQYAADKRQRLYSGPIDCTKRIVSCHPHRLFPIPC
jgi:solute carrier family 25 carnitine/acylcarnitine transporter 20/29